MVVDFSDPESPEVFGYYLADGTNTWDAKWYRGTAYEGDSGRGSRRLRGLRALGSRSRAGKAEGLRAAFWHGNVRTV